MPLLDPPAEDQVHGHPDVVAMPSPTVMLAVRAGQGVAYDAR